MKLIFGLLFLYLPIVAFSQIGTGQWRFHTATSKANDIAVTEDKIYTALENGLMITTISKNDEMELLNILKALIQELI